MKKQWIAGMLGAALFLTGTPVAAETDKAEDTLPFELEAPAHVSLVWWAGADTPSTMQVSYAMNDSMCQWLALKSDSNTQAETKKDLQETYGFSDLTVSAQIDWAIDDPENGWHYTTYWDGDDSHDIGTDADGTRRVSSWDTLNGWADPKTVNETWILRSGEIEPDASSADSEWFYGTEKTPGVRQQLQEGQYELLDHDEESDTKNIFIDYSVHTAYVRVRWAVTAFETSSGEEKKHYFFSNWSETVSYGKAGSAADAPLTEETLSPPDISNLRYAPEEFGGFPQLLCTLTVPENLANAVTRLHTAEGSLRVLWEVRLPGEEWVELSGGTNATTGDMTIALLELGTALQKKQEETGSSPSLSTGTPIELRARYLCRQNESLTGASLPDIYSDYSPVLTFTPEESISSAVTASEPSAGSVSAVSEQAPATPSGIQPWLWVVFGGVLIVAGAAVILISRQKSQAASKKKKK